MVSKKSYAHGVYIHVTAEWRNLWDVLVRNRILNMATANEVVKKALTHLNQKIDSVGGGS